MKVYVGAVTFWPSGETIQVRVVASKYSVACHRAVDKAVQWRTLQKIKIESIDVKLQVTGETVAMA